MRTLKLTAGAILAMWLVALGTAHAGVERAGTTAANFLSLGAGARTLSMGGATLGLGDDVGGAGWNPAALGWVETPELTLSHVGLQGGSLQEWASYGKRLAKSQTRLALSGTYQGNGSFEGRDANGAATGDFSASSMAVGATVSQQIGSVVTLGAGAKFVTEKLGPVSGSGYTFDLGVMVRRGPIGVGFAAQNVAGAMKYGSSSYPFPTSYGGGIAFTHAATGLRFALDANVPDAYYRDVRAGVEWTYRGMAAFRTGYRKELGSADDPLTGPSFGLGAGHNGTWLDYGYLLADGGGEHRVGLRFRIGGMGMNSGAFGAVEKPQGPRTARDPSFIGPPVPRKKR